MLHEAYEVLIVCNYHKNICSLLDLTSPLAACAYLCIIEHVHQGGYNTEKAKFYCISNKFNCIDYYTSLWLLRCLIF